MSVYEYTSAIHAHTTYSDGSGTVEEVVAAAQAADIQILILTDHNTLEARDRGYAGWHDDLLLIVGDEVSSRSGHCIALGIDHHVSHRQPLTGILDGIRDQDGHAYVAHPHGRYRPLLRTRDHSWQDWDAGEVTGLELWSYMFDWASTFRYYRFLSHYRDPDACLRGPDPETLRKWDELCERRRVVAFGGVDAHARTYPLFPLVVFPYQYLFTTIRTHVLTTRPLQQDSDLDTADILSALASGRCYLSRDNLGDATGTRFQSADGDLQMGAEATFDRPTDLCVTVPIHAEMTLLRDGVGVRTTSGTSMNHAADIPGVYRIEARLDGKPWLYTNPIYLRRPTADNKHL